MRIKLLQRGTHSSLRKTLFFLPDLEDFCLQEKEKKTRSGDLPRSPRGAKQRTNGASSCASQLGSLVPVVSKAADD
jgi:hypothetical protein